MADASRSTSPMPEAEVEAEEVATAEEEVGAVTVAAGIRVEEVEEEVTKAAEEAIKAAEEDTRAAEAKVATAALEADTKGTERAPFLPPFPNPSSSTSPLSFWFSFRRPASTLSFTLRCLASFLGHVANPNPTDLCTSTRYASFP